jgi:Zn-dependent protease
VPFRETVVFFACLVVAVILHEIGHGVAAYWFGDDSAKQAGRLTLNPIPHIDPFGSIVLPAMGALSGFPVFGYAKPVPVNVSRLRHPRRDIVFVSLAGPATNFALMTIGAVATRALLQPGGIGNAIDRSGTDLLVEIFFYFAVVNLFLGVFNLLPIPPLDGSAVIEPFLPREWLPGWYRFRPYGLLVVFGLLFMIPGFFSSIVDPFYRALYHFVTR